MAFFGIFILAIFLWLIVIGVFLIMIPALIIFIINLVKGFKNKWPKGNIVAVSITGSILGIFILLILSFILRIAASSGSSNVTSETVYTLMTYIAIR